MLYCEGILHSVGQVRICMNKAMAKLSRLLFQIIISQINGKWTYTENANG